MKRAVIVIMIAFMLVGCGNDEQKPPKPEAPQAKEITLVLMDDQKITVNAVECLSNGVFIYTCYGAASYEWISMLFPFSAFSWQLVFDQDSIVFHGQAQSWYVSGEQ